MSLKWRLVIASILVLSALIKIAPNFFNLEGKWWPAEGKITYGLDIQGGVHLVMGVDIDAVMKEKMTRTSRSLLEELKSADIKVKDVNVSNETLHEIKVTLENPNELSKSVELIEKNHKNYLQILSSGNVEILVKIYDTQVAEIKKLTLDQAIGVIRNRIDEFGVSEPSISAQGENRILVQLPGIKDSARAKELINRTAHLEFRIVSHELSPSGNFDENSKKLLELVQEAEKKSNYSLGKDGLNYVTYVKRINNDLKEKLPPNTMIAFTKAPEARTMEAGKLPQLLRTDTNIAGDLLEDAFVTYDERGQPQVGFKFGPEGSRRFGELTSKNINKQLAIVLDEVIQSSPVIQSKITSTGVISLNRGSQEDAFNEAKLIVATLRAGALPAALEQLEERSVGPTLGSDAIEKAKLAGLVAYAFIAGFMMLYYGVMGVIASIALALNVVCLIAVLTGLGATLTLPGVAGIILTMGVAVDANVIIFERIKEEFRKGSSLKLSIHDGFNNAYSAIIDSNVVAVSVALILFYYGTGPVRGFAVTLISGIVTSVFTAIFLSRVMIDLINERLGLKRA
ncbi:MAG: protein translocase subunit SecD [Bdellovibrionales bacterium]|nr:protein translocase subunit SecD [Bdellovibrionales bacterium]